MIPVAQYGFRPFFILAGLWAIAPMAVLLSTLVTGAWPADALPLFTWHGHEMLFGFAAAAIAGFLLTAVPSWTQTPAISGYPLAALIAIWIIARVAVAPWDTPSPLATALALAFFPALAAMVAPPLIATRNARNLPFLVLLALLFLAELLLLGPRSGWFAPPPFDPLRLAVNTIALMVTVVGGRIIPAFTRSALMARGVPASIRAQDAGDIAAVAAVAGVLVVDVIAPNGLSSGALAAIAAVLLALRFRGWQSSATRPMPLLWVLHLGYAWLVVGCAMKAAWFLGGFGWAQNWLHALTAGSFGTMILAVTTRAALGHTGRPLEVGPPIVVAYLLVSSAALLRIFGPVLFPRHGLAVLAGAAIAWLAAFALYLAIYVPILLRPRVDGRPG